MIELAMGWNIYIAFAMSSNLYCMGIYIYCDYCMIYMNVRKLPFLDPPSIIYTTEFIISNKEGFGKSGHLICTVQKSPDTNTSVSWFNKGEEITNTSKYTTNKEMEDENIVKYQLVVSDLQESDIGSYLCRLSSSYGIEDMQEAWIQVDYRKGMYMCTHANALYYMHTHSVPTYLYTYIHSDTNAINEHGSSHAHENEDQAFG